MKRQIALVGGQSVPVYLGIQEQKPEVVYLIASPESKHNNKRIKACSPGVQFEEFIVDPFAFQEISDLIIKLINKNKSDQWELNLTSGTKVMSIAAHNIFLELKNDVDLDSFYIDQKGRSFSLINREYTKLECEVQIGRFLKLSGHGRINNSSFGKYKSDDFSLSREWFDWLSKDKELDTLYGKVGYECSRVDDFKKSNNFNIDGVGSAKWNSTDLVVKTTSGRFNKTITHHNALEMCFTGLWWELLVANEVKDWELKKEMMVGVELLTNSKFNYAKNEIDIILSTGQNMIFIECKSGNVKQEDVNKMRAVKEMYGGISSRSILVCRKLPYPHILEKCNDLGIDVFALQKSKKGKFTNISTLDQLNSKLTELVKKSQL